MKNSKSVFGILKSKLHAQQAVDMLREALFHASDISVLMSEMEDTKSFAHEKETKAPEGAATGALTGAAIGSGLGWLAGIGVLAIPGVGPLIAAGPIVAALAVGGVGGTVGAVTGALIGLGVPEYVAKRYESIVNDGGILISVLTEDSHWLDKAKEVLKMSGAEDIACSDQSKSKKYNIKIEKPNHSIHLRH